MKPQINIESIDKLSCEFEDYWRFELSLDDILEFLTKRLPEQWADHPLLLAEIAQVDTELRWKHLANQADKQSVEGMQSLLLAMKQLPSTKEYLQWVTLVDDVDEIRRQIADAELKARGRFGDAPSPAIFGLPREQWHRYEKYLPKISIWRDQESQKEYAVVGPLKVGRQSLGEPDPIAVLHQNFESKLICCPLDEIIISRDQVRIDFLLGQWVKITNSSKNRDFTVTGQAVLRPGESTSLSLPCTLDLGKIRVRIRRP